MNLIFIDDRDPKINYTGTWNLGSTNNDTVSSSIKVGDHFSVPFTGTAIGVYGTYNSSSAGVKTSYSIDGRPPTTVTSRTSKQDSNRQLFWQSTPVGIGPHTLVVSMVAVNSEAAGGEGTVWFDYFQVSHAVAPPSAPKTASHAALIGGVTAGVVVLIIAAALLFLYLRRKRKYKSTLSATPITPLPPLFPATMAESGPRLAASTGKHGRAPGAMHTSAQSSSQPSETAASHNTEHSTSIADLKRQQQVVASSYEAGINRGNAQSTVPIQHVDSGMRELSPAAAGPAELPPVYTAT